MDSHWRLPTKSELNKMYVQLRRKWLGNYASAYYWYSSEYGFRIAWDQGNRNKDGILQVRLVRALPDGEICEGFVFFLDDKFFESAKKDDNFETADCDG